MGIRDRITSAARQLLAAGTPDAPPVAQATDVVDDPNALAQGSRGILGDLWVSTQAMYNAVTGVGTQRDASFFNAFAVPRPLRRGELYGLGRNGLGYQALSKLPNTAMREGWRCVVTDPDVEDPGACGDKVAAYEERLALPMHCARAMTRGRQYGEAMVVLGIDDGRPMHEPVDVTKIQSIRWAAVIDVRYYEPASLYQNDDANFTKVLTFRITDINGFLEDGLRYGPNSLSFTSTTMPWEGHATGGELIVHRDRVMHFPTVDYLPLLDTIQDSLGAFFETMSGIRTAARESTTVVYKVGSWLRKQWSENAGLASQHMAAVDRGKSSMNAWVIDKDKEDVDIKSRSLSGLADLVNPSMVWLSAALATPNTILFGVSPGGFGKGEAEIETWHGEARAYFAWAAKPEIHRVDGYIIAAQDGCQLPFTTQRSIEINDLSPPDEEVRSKLRSEALNDIRQLVKDDIISRAEARPAVAALADDYFRPDVDLDATDDAKTAQVGVFTASIALMQALYPTGIPVEAGRELMLALASTFFTPENVPQIFPDPAGANVATPQGAATRADPGDIEDDETQVEEPSEVDVAWSENPLPTDAMEAKAIAVELGLTPRQSGRITRAHTAGLIEGWNLLGGKPRYSLSEVKRVVLQGNGKLPVADKARDASELAVYSVAVMLRCPDDVAQWVPYKAEDSSAPHVTVLYVGDVSPVQVLPIIEAVRRVVAESPSLRVDFDANTLGYFDNDERVAFARVRKTPELQALHDALRRALVDTGAQVKHYLGGFTPHVTLAYLSPGEVYTGPVPPQGWTAHAVEVWIDDIAVPLYCAEQLVSDADDACDDFDEDAWVTAARDLSDEAKEKRIAEAYGKYHAAVNMGAAELRKWAATPWSKKASVSRAPIDRNLTLLETPREKWTLAHASSAMRTVNFVSRMKGNARGKPVKIDGREGPSKRDISLKNWAFDPGK